MAQVESTSYKLRPHKIALFLLVSFCGYYLTGLDVISPVYFIFALAIAISLVTFFTSATGFDQILLLPGLMLCYVLVTQPFLNPDPSSFIGIVFSILFFFATIFLLKKSRDRKELIFYGESFIRFSTLLLIVEAAWRMTHPQRVIDLNKGDVTDQVPWIYQYKFGSIMFGDSNFVGLFIIVILFFAIYLTTETGKSYRLLKWILVSLLFVTFSRSAWIAAILAWLIIKYVKKVSVRAVVGVILISIAIFISLKLVASDMSFLSKFEILRGFSWYLSQASLTQLLFGIGFGNTFDLLHIGAHNVLITFAMESGVIGCGIFIFLVYSLWRVTKGKGKYVIVPYIVASLSAFSHANPYFFVAIALIYFFEKPQFQPSSQPGN